MSSKIVVLITGANSGVGLAAVQAIAEASAEYHVIATGRSLEKVEAALASLDQSSLKGSVSAVQLDVTDDESIAQAVRHVETQHGRLDALINNAAVGDMQRDMRARLRANFETNVLGAALVAEAFRPLLLGPGSAAYSVFVSSGAGSAVKAWETPLVFEFEDGYCMSKAALNMIAVKEAKKYGPKGLKVICMTPGFVISNLRGTSEEMRTGWGKAQDPMVAGNLLLSIIRGERDADKDKLISKDGIYPW